VLDYENANLPFKKNVFWLEKPFPYPAVRLSGLPNIYFFPIFAPPAYLVYHMSVVVDWESRLFKLNASATGFSQVHNVVLVLSELYSAAASSFI